MRRESDDGKRPAVAVAGREQRTSPLQVNLDPGREYGGDGVKLLLEQYKIYVDSASKVSDRRGVANTFLLTANTGFITAYGIIAGKDVALGSVSGFWGWLAPLVGVTVCIAWFALIRAYRVLNSAKFEVIQELERHLPAQLYDQEWQHLKEGKTSRYTPLSHVEQLVPIIFGLIYVGLAVGARG